MPGVPPAWQWRGPRIRMSLPSFSGLTATQPNLLQYACAMHAAVRLSGPMTLRLPEGSRRGDAGEEGSKANNRRGETTREDGSTLPSTLHVAHRPCRPLFTPITHRVVQPPWARDSLSPPRRVHARTICLNSSSPPLTHTNQARRFFREALGSAGAQAPCWECRAQPGTSPAVAPAAAPLTTHLRHSH